MILSSKCNALFLYGIPINLIDTIHGLYLLQIRRKYLLYVFVNSKRKCDKLVVAFVLLHFQPILLVSYFISPTNDVIPLILWSSNLCDAERRLCFSCCSFLGGQTKIMLMGYSRHCIGNSFIFISFVNLCCNFLLHIIIIFTG